MQPDRPAPKPGSDFDRWGARLVEEKLRILRLLRALDRAGVNPTRVQRLRWHLSNLVAGDTALTGVFELVDRESRSESTLSDSIAAMLSVAVEVRGQVLEAIPGELRADVLCATDEAAASDSEVWQAVDALRERERRQAERERAPDSKAEAQAGGQADTTPGRSRRTPLPGQRRARAEERRELPGPDAPLAMWFARLPDPWREGIAAMHEVDVAAAANMLPLRLARRLSDAAWLRRFVAERLGEDERQLLGRVLDHAVGLEREPAEQATFDVPWDWRVCLPQTTGGRLRLAGLVHVGMAVSTKIAVIPPGLRAPVRQALVTAT